MFPDIVGTLIEDPQIWRHPTALRVYRELWKNPHIYHEPQGIKAWGVARRVRTSRLRVQKALELLIRRGYIIDCGRDTKGVRQIMLARHKG